MKRKIFAYANLFTLDYFLKKRSKISMIHQQLLRLIPLHYQKVINKELFLYVL